MNDESRIKETIQKSKTRLNEDNRTKLNELEIFKKVPFEFKDGWTDLIYELGKDITELCELTNCELPMIQQIKEKFGTLRFYYNTLNSQYPPIVEKSIRALVTVAEIKTTEICEYCGKYGELRVSKRGLYFTVCDEHKEDSLTSKEYEELVLKKTPQNRQKAI
ncbi:hypothetical protein [Aliarcobacter butzleri]|uniref:hypothetical protein n=1 Tax=Aliarcobacter butzleri TaxID=28197 RepID=UPI001EDA753D|nr:hypothetical protein [Aliarcobacter butzleri]MCG3654989.1 hypothetical protein [Aliarcobacter butzleri]MCT7587749.1 hypothetical protein [Aliarcobacter butzleri]